VGPGRQTSGREVRLALPAIDWWWWFGLGGRRRATAAEQSRRGLGGSDSGEDRGGVQQCVARAASMWPREGARGSLGLEDRRRGELSNGGPAAAAEGRAPASRQFG
jgi:hypothetical protein